MQEVCTGHHRTEGCTLRSGLRKGSLKMTTKSNQNLNAAAVIVPVAVSCLLTVYGVWVSLGGDPVFDGFDAGAQAFQLIGASVAGLLFCAFAFLQTGAIARIMDYLNPPDVEVAPREGMVVIGWILTIGVMLLEGGLAHYGLEAFLTVTAVNHGWATVFAICAFLALYNLLAKAFYLGDVDRREPAPQPRDRDNVRTLHAPVRNAGPTALMVATRDGDEAGAREAEGRVFWTQARRDELKATLDRVNGSRKQAAALLGYSEGQVDGACNRYGLAA